MLVDGIGAVITAIGGRKDNPDWGWMLTGGLLGALVGLLTLRAPAASALVIVLYVAVWAMMVGVTQIVTAIRIRNEIDNEWMLILGGVLAVLLGLFILWSPGAGVLSMLWTIAAFAFLFGVLLIFAGLRLRGVTRKMKHAADQVTRRAQARDARAAPTLRRTPETGRPLRQRPTSSRASRGRPGQT